MSPTRALTEPRVASPEVNHFDGPAWHPPKIYFEEDARGR